MRFGTPNHGASGVCYFIGGTVRVEFSLSGGCRSCDRCCSPTLLLQAGSSAGFEWIETQESRRES